MAYPAMTCVIQDVPARTALIDESDRDAVVLGRCCIQACSPDRRAVLLERAPIWYGGRLWISSWRTVSETLGLLRRRPGDHW